MTINMRRFHIDFDAFWLFEPSLSLSSTSSLSMSWPIQRIHFLICQNLWLSLSGIILNMSKFHNLKRMDINFIFKQCSIHLKIIELNWHSGAQIRYVTQFSDRNFVYCPYAYGFRRFNFLFLLLTSDQEYNVYWILLASYQMLFLRLSWNSSSCKFFVLFVWR